ncbi:ATPase, T2SS/T4P/T4SS family [Paenibacillus sp. FSL L8-0696]|uniref:ATPase, T2SS/T4P/T4SS family n=1 Tax=Paenibacillus sp. FSL L8-0696 TaxID=2954524 RepID=UPI00311A5D49
MSHQVPFSLKSRVTHNRKINSDNFYEYLQVMREDFSKILRQDDDNYFELNTKALLGDSKAISFFMNEIEKYIRRKPYGGTIPEAYSSLSEALYHEWKGFATAFRWFTDKAYSASSGLQIIGQNIFYKENGDYEAYPYKMPTLDRVEQLKRTLMKSDPNIKLNANKPSAEFNMDDPLWPGRFIRIAIWVYPRIWNGFTTITFRRQIVNFMTYDEQAGKKTIGYESIKLHRLLGNTFRNTVVAGATDSGKSTLANTHVGEQLIAADHKMGGILIEKHPESTLPYIMSDHRLIPIRAENEELMDVGIESLRHDPEIIFMTEMRYNEWQFYLFSGEKGHKGLTGTYHTEDPEDIPYQAALAVQTRIGGSLKGHLISALKSIEIVSIMESMSNGVKKETRVSEIYFDELNNSVFANDLIRYERDSDSWTYNSHITERLKERMIRKDPNAAKLFFDELDRLSKEKPMKNPMKESLKSKILLQG